MADVRVVPSLRLAWHPAPDDPRATLEAEDGPVLVGVSNCEGGSWWVLGELDIPGDDTLPQVYVQASVQGRYGNRGTAQVAAERLAERLGRMVER